MKRKIIQQGHGTLTITLPMKWAKKYSLSSGDEVNLIEKDSGLFLSTDMKIKEKAIKIDITDMDIPSIWKYFMAVYREGYSEVKIMFSKEKAIQNPYKYFMKPRKEIKNSKTKISKNQKLDSQIDTIEEALQSFVDRFIGFEIIEHKPNYIIIREMGQPTTKEFDYSLRRVFLLIQQMINEIKDVLNEDSHDLIAHITNLDINLDKFHDYCVRILNQTNYMGQKKSSLMFSTLYLLELIGDELKNTGIHLVQDFPNSKFEKITDFVKLVEDQWDYYYKLFYSYDIKKISKLSELDKQIYYQVPKLYHEASEDEKEIFHHLRMVSTYINALLELRIEIEVCDMEKEF
jgi:phosphate uptake regulator